MRVVVFGLRGFPGVQGGIEKHCEELYPRLAALGAGVTVITRKRYMKGAPPSYRGVRLIKSFSLPGKFLENISHSFFAVFMLKRLRPDIVHIHSIGSSLAAPLVKWISGGRYKIVVTNHGPDYMRKKWNAAGRFVLETGERSAVRYADAMICVSKWIRDFISEKYGKNVYYIPNGIAHKENGAAERGMPAEAGRGKKKYILCVTRFVPEKGVTDLIRAYSIARKAWTGEPRGGRSASGSEETENAGVFQRFPELVIVGKADHQSAYSREISRLSSETPGVTPAGALYGEDLSNAYMGASLFVLPSYYEGLPLVLLEALSFGVPVLVSDIKAHRELGLPEFRYFTPGDVPGLSAKISECLARGIGEDERKKYTELIKSEYNWDNIASKTIEIYKNLINKM